MSCYEFQDWWITMYMSYFRFVVCEHTDICSVIIYLSCLLSAQSAWYSAFVCRTHTYNFCRVLSPRLCVFNKYISSNVVRLCLSNLLWIIWFSNHSILSIPDEGYSRNVSCTLNLIQFLNNVIINKTKILLPQA